MSGLRLVTVTFSKVEDSRKTLSKQSSSKESLVGSGLYNNTTKSSSFGGSVRSKLSERNLFGTPGSIQFAGTVFEMLKENNYAHEPTWVEGRTHHIMTFRSRGKEARMVLEEVMKTGIGKHFGRIDLAEITASIPTLKRLVSRSTDERRSLKYCPCLGKRSFTLTDRMTLQEIHGIVDGQLHLTCEYITLVFVAAIIASIGLRRNSATTVISSMLVSPLMGPILGMTFGLAIRDKTMIWKSFRNEAIGIIICFLIGMLVALIDCYVRKSTIKEVGLEFRADQTTPANLEMYGRTQPEDIGWGLFVAIPSGVGVALAISSGGINALVGVAISAALLPPICNAGMLLVYAIHFESELHVMWKYSLALFAMNLTCIILVGFLTFRIKGIKPPKATLLDLWRRRSAENSMGSFADLAANKTQASASRFSMDISLVPGKKSDAIDRSTNSWTEALEA